MALSNAERQQRHRDKWGPTINKNQILRRVAKKSIPQMDSMQTHNITLPIINTIRDESKLPLIYEPYQLSEERGVPMKVISTGGLAPLFQQTEQLFDAFEDDLTIHGLTVINTYNKSLN